jgi:hypothetical protein
MKKRTKQIFIAGVFLILIIAIGFYVKSAMNANAIQQKNYEGWLKDNCNCTLKEKVICREGYELVGSICKGFGAYTNPLLTCSQYNCTGEIVNWDNDKEKWNPVIWN